MLLKVILKFVLHRGGMLDGKSLTSLNDKTIIDKNTGELSRVLFFHASLNVQTNIVNRIISRFFILPCQVSYNKNLNFDNVQNVLN